MKRPLRLALAFAFLPLALPELSTAAPEPGTWWVGADAWLAELVNVNLDVALRNDPSLTSGGEIVALDYGPEFSGRIRGGWQAKEASENSYSLSYWSYDQGESVSASGGVLPVISDPLFGNFNSQSVESTANVKSAMLDLILSRRLAGSRKAAWTWGVGLRQASFEKDWIIEYTDSVVVPSGPRETVRLDLESKGVGMTAGVGGSFNWGHKIRTLGRVQAALLRGDTDFAINDRGFNDDILVQAFQTTGIERSGEDRLFQQVELEARVIYRVWKTLDLSLGYMFTDLGEMSHVDRFLDDIQGAPGAFTNNASFHGIVFGASYLFE